MFASIPSSIAASLVGQSVPNPGALQQSPPKVPPKPQQIRASLGIPTPQPAKSIDMASQADAITIHQEVQAVPVRVSVKEVELEGACKNLQKQVTELQEVLTSMSNYMFQGGIISADLEADNGNNIHIKILKISFQDTVQLCWPHNLECPS